MNVIGKAQMSTLILWKRKKEREKEEKMATYVCLEMTLYQRAPSTGSEVFGVHELIQPRREGSSVGGTGARFP